MTQPVWKYVDNLGDRNPLDYGGLFVYEDETGIYPGEMERLGLINGKYEIHRVVLSKCTYVNDVLSDNKYHPEFPAWFAKHVKYIAESYDMEVKEVIEMFCSEDVKERAWAYKEVAEHFGYNNFDEYPLRLTENEVRERYKQGELD